MYIIISAVHFLNIFLIKKKILSHASAKMKTKMFKGFRFRTFSGCFQVT